jgi:hypothetical protein
VVPELIPTMLEPFKSGPTIAFNGLPTWEKFHQAHHQFHPLVTTSLPGPLVAEPQAFDTTKVYFPP